MERYDSLTLDSLFHMRKLTRELPYGADIRGEATYRLLQKIQLQRVELETRNRELIQKRKELEAERIRRETAFEHAPTCCLVLDRQGTILDLNHAAARLLGGTPDELAKTSLLTWLTPTSVAAFKGFLHRLCAEGRASAQEVRRKGTGRATLQVDGMPFPGGGYGAACLVTMTDTTAARQTERELMRRHAELDTLMRATPLGIGLICNRVFKRLSGRFLEMLDYRKDELLNRSARLVYPDDTEFERVGREMYGQLANRGVAEVESWMRRRDGSLINVRLGASVLDPNDVDAGVIFTAWDITARKRAEAQLHLDERVFDSFKEGLLITDASQRILSVNPAFCQMTGYTAEQAIGSTPRLLHSGRHDHAFYATMWREIEAEGRWEGEIWNRRHNGDIYPEWLTITTITNDAGEVSHYVGIFTDITSQAHNRDHLLHLAYHDQLTGLPNRELFYERFKTLRGQAQRRNTGMALLFLDLDDFKAVNDSHGHVAGDRLIQMTAERLEAAIRKADVVCRLGGDEFLVLLPEIVDTAGAREVARKIDAAFAAPFDLEDQVVTVSASIGIACYPEAGEDIETLIRKADAEMYAAKKSSHCVN